MVRNYVRKTTRGADGSRYSRHDLQLAVDDVKEGRKTMKGAARHYNIPRTTLKHHVLGTRGQGVLAKEGNGGGGKPSIPVEDEKKLSEGLACMEKWGFGLSREEVLDVVQMYVQGNNIKTKFKNDRPGADWFRGFMQRHRLSVKKPQGVEYVRADQINPFVVYGFLDLIEKTIKDLALENKPHLIFNLDETSFSHDPSKTKVVGAKGAKCTRTISSAGRENTSVLICCSASGQKLPPLCVFKGKNVMESWLSTNSNDQTSYAATKRGWMESKLFYRWFEKCFLERIPKERPILLIYDGHSSHINYETLRLARENNITIAKLPPHTTHVLQPLDVGVFKAFKAAWDKQLVKWQRANPRRRIPKREFVEILSRVLDELPEKDIDSGFRKTGIYDRQLAMQGLSPVNRKAIGENIFRPSDLERYKKDLAKECRPSNSNLVLHGNTVDKPPHVTADNEAGPQSSSTSNLVPNGTSLDKSFQGTVESEATRKNSSTTDLTLPIGITVDKPSKVTPENKAERQNNSPLPSTSFENILLKLVKPSNRSDNQTTKRRRICTEGEIITTQEYTEKLKVTRKSNENDQKQNKNGQKTKKSKQKALEESSSDSDNISFNSDESEDEQEQDFDVLVNDYVVVRYDRQFYPGQVLAVKNDNVVEVKHMTKSGKVGWRWPHEDDVLDYQMNEIIKIIPPPIPINKRGMYRIPAMEKYT